MRFLGVIPVLLYVQPTPTAFFTYQLLIAVIELMALIVKSYMLLPRLERPIPLLIGLKPIYPILKFSASISFLSIVWILVTQTDKLVLSKMISLADYGLFTLAASAASAIMIFSVPISSAIQPRLALFHAENREPELIELYRKSAHFVSIIVFPVAMVLVFFARHLLWVWTNDHDVSNAIYPVFSLYVLGNALLTVTAFQYFLQFAKGDMRLHIYGNIFFLIFLVPSIVAAVLAFGMIGAGYAWFFANLVFFLFWVPIVHRKFAKGIHLKWLVHDVGTPMLTSAVIASAMWVVLPMSENRLLTMAYISVSGLVVLTCTVLFSADARNMALALVAKSGVFKSRLTL